MNISKSSNPAFKNAFQARNVAAGSTDVMTLNGTINKTLLSLVMVIVSAAYTWKMVNYGASNAMIWTFGGAIGGFILALVTIFKKEWSAYTVPIYSLLEGLFLGGISALVAGSVSSEAGGAINNTIVIQAVTATFGVFFVMLLSYRSGMLKATKKFTRGVVGATGGVFILYLAGFVLSMFGIEMNFLYGNSLMAIGINLVVIVIAALNLILDFDFIEKGVAANAPKYMEWYGAFGLMVTLIWLYIEILRLLSRLAGRD